jgi:hypothetical protein
MFCRVTGMFVAAVVGVMLTPLPASAQMNLSGDWAPRMHEDQPDRGPGPELGDYTGLPLNEGAAPPRRYAFRPGARASAGPHRPHSHGPLQVRIWEE